MVKYAACQKRQAIIAGKDRNKTMAKCAHCGKSTTFGHNRSFSLRATNRSFKPNLQKVTVLEGGRQVKKVLCAKCIRTMTKTA
jgi:large subunit ribosomal protein L28